MKKVLLLGGTGAMGQHLVQLLVNRGDLVTVTTRESRLSLEKIDFIQGDAKDPNFLDLLLTDEWDAIIDFMVYSTKLFEQQAPKLLTATKQYIFLSSARVYADSEYPIQENTPRLLDCSNDSKFLATDEYSLAKARQENILKKSQYKNWTIIRPYITYSEQRLQLGVFEKEAWLYRAMKGRTIIFSEDIANKLTTLTYGFDVALAMLALIGEPRAYAHAFHITQGKAISWKAILNIYLDVLEAHLGKRPNVLFLSMDKFSLCTHAGYQIKYDRLFHRSFDNTRISCFIDINCFMPVQHGLVQSLKEFLNNPKFTPIDWRAEAVKDRYSKEFTPLAEIPNWKSKLKYLLVRFLFF